MSLRGSQAAEEPRKSKKKTKKMVAEKPRSRMKTAEKSISHMKMAEEPKQMEKKTMKTKIGKKTMQTKIEMKMKTMQLLFAAWNSSANTGYENRRVAYLQHRKVQCPPAT
jgi:hypothetical protein